MAIVCAIVNQKGGVGKTTSAATIAHGLALQKLTVALIDLDPQGNLALSLGLPERSDVAQAMNTDVEPGELLRPADRPEVSLFRPGLWLLAGNSTTGGAWTERLMADDAPIDLLTQFLPAYTPKSAGRRKELDVIIVDTGPTVGGLQEIAMYAADQVIIPTELDFMSASQVLKTLKTLAKIRAQSLQDRGKGPTLLGVLPTRVDPQTSLATTILSDLRLQLREVLDLPGEDEEDDASLGGVLMPPIRHSVVFGEAAALQRTIWEYRPRRPDKRDMVARAQADYAVPVWRIGDHARAARRH
jgi:chromosome partitioning protein